MYFVNKENSAAARDLMQKKREQAESNYFLQNCWNTYLHDPARDEASIVSYYTKISVHL
jgi:hypothetical protein